ncbi:hypothetical protein [Legionella hackeliae]|nr:hypothetical protein [Legionella hackeliae]
MKTGICEKICKFLDSAQPDFKPFNIDYEKAISELHEMIRINYSRKSESKMFRGIQELVKAFGDNSKTDKKLGSRQEMETLLEQLIANDQNAVARVNQSLNIALVLTPSIISQLKKLKELVTQESALKQVLRELGLRYTVKDKLQYLNGLKRGEENLSEEAWEQIEVLKASLWAMNPKMLTQTESYRKMGPNSRFFKLLGETVTSHPCITSVVEQSLP